MRISHETVLTYVEGLIKYLESEEDSQLADKVIMKKLCASIKKKLNGGKKNCDQLF